MEEKQDKKKVGITNVRTKALSLYLQAITVVLVFAILVFSIYSIIAVIFQFQK